MATEAVQPRLKTLTRRVNFKVERAFYAGMAVLIAIVVVIGFSRSYYLAGMVRAPLPNRLVHVHGAVMTLWMLLFLVQTAFVAAGRIAWHRILGTIAFCLPPIMVILGTITAIDGMRRGSQIGPFDPQTSLAIPLLGMPLFATVIWAAWKARRRPDAHKRLVIYGTIGLCGAAFGRFPWHKMGITPGAGATIGLAALLALMLLYDLVSLRRIHRSSMWAAPLTFLTISLSIPIGMTPAWHQLAAFLLKHVAPAI